MDPAVVMVHPPKRPPLQVRFATIVFAFFGSQKQAIAISPCQGGGGPPGIPSQTFSNPAFQAQMAGLTPSQQAQVREAFLKKKTEFYEKVSQNGGPPPPRTAFMKSLFRILTVFLVHM